MIAAWRAIFLWFSCGRTCFDMNWVDDSTLARWHVGTLARWHVGTLARQIDRTHLRVLKTLKTLKTLKLCQKNRLADQIPCKFNRSC